MEGDLNINHADKLVSQVNKLAELIEYQEGSVVSRGIIDKDVGTVTLFAFDKDQGLSEHTAPFDAFVYVLDGEAKITIWGKSSNVGEGEMIIMPANQSHALKATKNFKMLLIMIKVFIIFQLPKMIEPIYMY